MRSHGDEVRVPHHFVEQHSVGEGRSKIRTCASAAATTAVGVFIQGKKDLLVDHLREALLISLPLLSMTANHIAGIARVLKRGRFVGNGGPLGRSIGRRALALLTSKCFPGDSYQCWAMPSKVPQLLASKPPVQSTSDPYIGSRLSTYFARSSPFSQVGSSIFAEPMRVIDGSTARIALANSLFFRT